MKIDPVSKNEFGPKISTIIIPFITMTLLDIIKLYLA